MNIQADFERFYNQHFDKVYRYVYFRTGKDAELTQDLVSEIFMKVLEHFESYDATRSITSWLFTIAHNHLANHWRGLKPVISLDLEATNSEATDEVSADTLLSPVSIELWKRSVDKAAVGEILAKLSQPERDIVTFHYLFGYNYAEIASLKNMSEAAVKVAAYRAIKKMRQWL